MCGVAWRLKLREKWDPSGRTAGLVDMRREVGGVVLGLEARRAGRERVERRAFAGPEVLGDPDGVPIPGEEVGVGCRAVDLGVVGPEP